MRYPPINNQLFIKNRKKLCAKLPAGSFAIVNSNDQMPRNGDQTFPFRQNSDLFYLTGIEQEKTVLLLFPDHPTPELREILFLLKSNKKLEIWEGHKLTRQEATEISGVKTAYTLDQLAGIIAGLMVDAEQVFLNSNENGRFTTDVPYRDFRFINTLKAQYPLHDYKRLAPIMAQLRLIKEPEEIELVQQACNITNDAFKRILRFIRPGVREYEIEAEITHEFIRQGASGHAYAPIVASGADTCTLHYGTNHKVCRDGDLILMDFGAEYANYAADTTRTVPVSGRFTPRQRQVYNAVLRILKQAKTMLVPGTTINKYHREVVRLMELELIELGLLTESQVKNEPEDLPISQKAVFEYYMHGTSHFMGLDVHDLGSKDTVLQAGMLFSCEPGIYIPNEQIGIRLENDILVTNDQPLDLLANEPVEADDIEAIMLG